MPHLSTGTTKGDTMLDTDKLKAIARAAADDEGSRIDGEDTIGLEVDGVTYFVTVEEA